MDHAQELPAGAGGGDPEVPEKAKRRQFDSAYKLRILEEADRSTELDNWASYCVARGCIRLT